MENQRQVQVNVEQPGSIGSTGLNVPVPTVKSKKTKKEGLYWLYVLIVILVISLIAYYLIDNKIITMPSFSSSGSTASPSLTTTSTLGSTFMSLH